MIFKAKLRKIGNSLGVIIPANVITSYKEGDDIELNVITSKDKVNDNVITSVKDKGNVITSDDKKENDVITSKPIKKKKFNDYWCDKHNVYKISCGCK